MSAEAEKLQEITARALKIREAANELAELADELLAAIEEIEAWIERQCQVEPSVPPALVAELAEIAAARAALDARQQAITAQLLRIAQGDTP